MAGVKRTHVWLRSTPTEHWVIVDPRSAEVVARVVMAARQHGTMVCLAHENGNLVWVVPEDVLRITEQQGAQFYG